MNCGPVAGGAWCDVPLAALQPPSMSAAPASILIVDDIPANVLAMQGILASDDYCLVTANSGEEALRCLTAAPDDFAAILLDVQMPGMDGFETARLIRQRERWQSTPILFLTATQPESVSILEGYASGAVDYIIKPVSPDVLRAKTAVFAELHRRRQALHATNLMLRAEIRAREQAEAELRLRHSQMEADLALARDIQLALLPHHYPPFPHFVSENSSALHFSHRYLPAATLGGDFFHVLAISDTRAGIFISDVMGHGVRSALIAAMMRALINESRFVASDPGRFLAEANRGLLEILGPTGEKLFATAFYLVADAATGRVTYANAGHPPPFWLRRAAGGVETLGGDHGPALGLFMEAHFPANERSLAVGDAVLLHTDGIIEAENEAGESFGAAGLEKIIREQLRGPMTALQDGALAAARQFRGQPPDEPFEDDVCLLGMELASLVKDAPDEMVSRP